MIAATESGLGVRLLISQNIANKKAKIENPHPAVSIFNFHYASPPDAVAMNFQLQKVIGDNETGFAGTQDFTYRREAWEFILAGGGLFNYLDYSFAAGHEDGSFAYPLTQPGGGNAASRRQMRLLKEFIHGFTFTAMAPDSATVTGLPQGLSARSLSTPGQAYTIYLCPPSGTKPAAGPLNTPRPVTLQLQRHLQLPAGAYRAEWIDPLTGDALRREELAHPGETARLVSPPFAAGMALRLRR